MELRLDQLEASVGLEVPLPIPLRRVYLAKPRRILVAHSAVELLEAEMQVVLVQTPMPTYSVKLPPKRLGSGEQIQVDLVLGRLVVLEQIRLVGLVNQAEQERSEPNLVDSHLAVAVVVAVGLDRIQQIQIQIQALERILTRLWEPHRSRPVHLEPLRHLKQIHGADLVRERSNLQDLARILQIKRINLRLADLEETLQRKQAHLGDSVRNLLQLDSVASAVERADLERTQRQPHHWGLLAIRQILLLRQVPILVADLAVVLIQIRLEYSEGRVGADSSTSLLPRHSLLAAEVASLEIQEILERREAHSLPRQRGHLVFQFSDPQAETRITLQLGHSGQHKHSRAILNCNNLSHHHRTARILSSNWEVLRHMVATLLSPLLLWQPLSPKKERTIRTLRF